MRTNEVIASRRARLGLTQEQLADLVGVSKRQILRYEEDLGQAPSLPVAAKLAEVLGVSLSTLAGRGGHDLDLSGEWWSAWQTWMRNVERVEIERLMITQDATFLAVAGQADPDHVATGSYSWAGELRLIHDETLSGWYVSTAPGVRSNGSIFLTMHSSGQFGLGRWSGRSHDGIVESGWGAIARERSDVEGHLAQIKGTVGTLRDWPDPVVP